MVWATAASSRPTVGFTGVGTSPTITLSVANETFPGIVAFQNEAGEKIVRGSGGAERRGRGGGGRTGAPGGGRGGVGVGGAAAAGAAAARPRGSAAPRARAARRARPAA